MTPAAKKAPYLLPLGFARWLLFQARTTARNPGPAVSARITYWSSDD